VNPSTILAFSPPITSLRLSRRSSCPPFIVHNSPLTIKPIPLLLPGWTALARLPETVVYPAPPPPLTLLLHGWLGDESVTWIFAPRLPKHHLLIAPRAIYEPQPGRYGWAPDLTGYPTFAELQPAVASLLDLLDKIKTQLDYDPGPINLLGFSQGAALAYAFALTHPHRVAAIAGLAGFVPPGAETLLPDQVLTGKRIFIAHGAEDETVPVEVARQGVMTLEQLGATVTYCEDQVGHKLGANCFRALGEFF
jgi:phospholipase/carboxylesterase